MEQLKQQISELEAQEAEIEQLLNLAETIEEERKVTNDLNLVRNRLSEKREELRIAQERQEVIEEKVQGITLPHDFNEVFDDPRANDIMTELIKTFQRQAYEAHSIEVSQITAEWQDKLRAAEDRESQLKRQNDELQVRNNALTDENASLYREVEQANLLATDAGWKRDAAVRELEAEREEVRRLNQHIDDLRQQLANAPAPKTAIEIGSSDRLSQLVSESKKAKESLSDKVNRGLARWGMEPLDVPELGGSESSDSFRNETEPTGDQLRDQSTAQGNHGVQQEGMTFPPVPDTTLPGMEAPAIRSGAAEDDQGTLSRQEFEIRIREVKEEIKAELVHEFGLARGAA